LLWIGLEGFDEFDGVDADWVADAESDVEAEVVGDFVSHGAIVTFN